MGVAHLAYTLANQIYQLQGRDLDITRSDVKCAEVAGVLWLPHSDPLYNQCHGTSLGQHASAGLSLLIEESITSRVWTCIPCLKGTIEFYPEGKCCVPTLAR